MIIRGILVGTCIINDLRDLRITGGQFYDLTDEFTEYEISNSLKPPNGSLYIALQAKLIDKILRDSLEYKQWREKMSRDEREVLRKKSRRPVSMEMTEYWKMSRGHRVAYIQGLTEHDFPVMEKAREKETDGDILDMLNEKLSLYQDIRLPSGFVLLR